MSTEDIVAITQLVLRERDGRVHGYWKEMEDVFHPDAEINLAWMKGSRDDFIENSRNRSPATNSLVTDRLEPVLVRVNIDRAIAIIGCTISVRTEVDGIEVDMDQNTKLLYMAERKQGQWKLMGLQAIYERDKFTSTIPGMSLPPLDPSIFNSYRPSYRCLSYMYEKKGREMSQEAPGNGKYFPEKVSSLKSV